MSPKKRKREKAIEVGRMCPRCGKAPLTFRRFTTEERRGIGTSVLGYGACARCGYEKPIRLAFALRPLVIDYLGHHHFSLAVAHGLFAHDHRKGRS